MKVMRRPRFVSKQLEVCAFVLWYHGEIIRVIYDRQFIVKRNKAARYAQCMDIGIDTNVFECIRG